MYVRGAPRRSAMTAEGGAATATVEELEDVLDEAGFGEAREEMTTDEGGPPGSASQATSLSEMVTAELDRRLDSRLHEKLLPIRAALAVRPTYFPGAEADDHAQKKSWDRCQAHGKGPPPLAGHGSTAPHGEHAQELSG